MGLIKRQAVVQVIVISPVRKELTCLRNFWGMMGANGTWRGMKQQVSAFGSHRAKVRGENRIE